MTSFFSSVNWKGCIGKYTSPYSLYGYKERPTPNDYAGQQTIPAFRLTYDRNSKTTNLQHNEQIEDGIAVEFSNTGNLPEDAIVDEITGWYLCHEDRVKFDWDRLKTGTEMSGQDELEKKKNFQWLREKEGHIDGINRLWAIRGYFIGPDDGNAPPCITVLCAYENVARFLVESIHSRLRLHKGWGATRLPGVKVIKCASSPGSHDHSDNSDNGDHPDISDQDSLGATVDGEAERNLIRIEIGSTDNRSMPTMTNGNLSSWARKHHRCGVQVEVVRESEVISKATIGGIIIVGDEVYGLTVGHLFSPSAGGDEGEQQSLSAEMVATMSTWQGGRACGVEFDWALVKIPGLQKRDIKSWNDINLVQTVSGEFRPVLVALEEPSPYTQVVLATPGSTRCLRGVLVGLDAVVNIPESPAPYATWVCRMEQPWLVQSGDSGSWVLDAQNGNLLGVLVAGCPELQEAYIIPAHEIIDDIQQHYPDRPVNLPNCHPISRANQIELHRHIDEYGYIVKSFEDLDSLEELEKLDSRILKWIEKAETFTNTPSTLYTLRGKESPWRHALSVLHYRSLANEERLGSTVSKPDGLEGLLRTALQQSPLRCYNFMNETFVAHQDPQGAVMLRRLWRYLMLGQTNYSLNDEDIPEATQSANALRIKEEARLMMYRTSAECPGLRSPWDINSTAKLYDRPRGLFPWHGHASEHELYVNFPRSFRDRFSWGPHGGDYVSTEMGTRRSDWPPWDRLTARGVLDRLREDLQGLITTQRQGVEVSLPETKKLDSPFISDRLEPDSDVILLAVKLISSDNGFWVIFPPPSVGPSTFSQHWYSAPKWPEYAIDEDNIKYSAWRLPFILTDKRVPDEENLEVLLSTQLNIHMGDFKQRRKLDLRHEHSRFYLKEHNCYVDVVIYEGHVEDTSSSRKHRPTGWLMQEVFRAPAGYHLSPPFSAILYKVNM